MSRSPTRRGTRKMWWRPRKDWHTFDHCYLMAFDDTPVCQASQPHSEQPHFRHTSNQRQAKDEITFRTLRLVQRIHETFLPSLFPSNFLSWDKSFRHLRPLQKNHCNLLRGERRGFQNYQMSRIIILNGEAQKFPRQLRARARPPGASQRLVVVQHPPNLKPLDRQHSLFHHQCLIRQGGHH
jgi:hypothetical protein